MLSLKIVNKNKGLSIYYVSRYNKAGSVGMLTNAYIREQGIILMPMKFHLNMFFRDVIKKDGTTLDDEYNLFSAA